MTGLTETQCSVLNAITDDFENLEQIYRSICFEFSAERYTPSDPNAFYWREAAGAVPLSEIVEALRALVERGFLLVRLPQGGAFARSSHDMTYLWHGWFEITDLGRKALEHEFQIP